MGTSYRGSGVVNALEKVIQEYEVPKCILVDKGLKFMPFEGDLCAC